MPTPPLSSQDTIAAISSPPGRSLRGLVRLTGPETRSIVGRMSDRQDHAFDQLRPCRVRLPAIATPNGMIELAVLLLLRHAPASFTGQDMAEIQCPGNPTLLERFLHRSVDLGARLAEPGEFTFRAFLSGKVDLTQAEGIAATIAATSESQLQAAARLRGGALGRFASDLVGQLTGPFALVEAGIDFVDQEDVVPITPRDLDGQLSRIEEKLDELLSHSRSWGAIEALPRVVLAGAPSTGKSTLFNALLGRQRAVISPMPGTTRDVLAEPLILNASDGHGIELMLVDLAGLDAPETALDHEVQRAARDAVAGADVILQVQDDDDWGQPEVHGILATTGSTPVLRVRSKIDLARSPSGRHDVAVSAVTGEGLDELGQAIAARVGDRAVSVSSQMLALQPRHEAALRSAAENLASGRQLLAGQLDRHQIQHVELVAGSLRAALDALACLGGKMAPDDIIGRVFATFCIGK